MAELTTKQRLFIEHFLQCLNGTEAARLAGYGGDSNALAAAASRLLRNVKIREEVDRRISAEAMSANEVLWRLAEHARGTLADFIEISDETGQAIVDFEKAKKAAKLGLVKKIRYSIKGGLEVELYDAQRALELLGKAHGIFKEQREHEVRVHIETPSLTTLTNAELDTLAQLARRIKAD